MMYRLISLTGPTKGHRITVEEEPMTLGRDPECTVCLDDPEVARQHAVIEHRRDGLVIRDLGSMNRIIVNKREVRASHLKHGDMVELGRTRFLVQAVVQAEVDTTTYGFRRRNVRIAMGAIILVAIGTLAFFTEHSPKKSAKPAPVAAPLSPPKPARPVREAADGSTSSNPEVTAEIRQMRKDLEHITKAVKNIAAKQATSMPPPAVMSAAPAPTPAPQPDAEPDDPQAKYNRRMFREAQAAIASNHLDEADAMLAELQEASPDFLPSYVLRAGIYEKRGMLEKAIGQWSQVIHRSTETPEYEQASAERIRLGEALRKTAIVEVPKIKISSVTQRRFPQTEDYDEMRVFDITLTPTSEELMDDSSVRVEIWFFDEDVKSGKVSLTRAIAPKDPLVPRGVWAAGHDKSITASYVVPKGSRVQDPAPDKQEQFYGYIMRLYHGDELQDEVARPRTLLNTTPDTLPAESAAGGASNEPARAVAPGGNT